MHAWVNYQSILQKCVVGRLSRSSGNNSNNNSSSSSSTENVVSNTTNCSLTKLDLIKSCMSTFLRLILRPLEAFVEAFLEERYLLTHLEERGKKTQVKYDAFSASNANQENLPEDNPSNVKMDWRQTSNSITLFYHTVRDYPGVCYQLRRISDSKLVFKLFFERDIITHELDLAADIEWPPVCKRNLDTMEVTPLSCSIFRYDWKPG